MKSAPVDFPSWAQISPKRQGHVRRVAALATEWAGQMGVSRQERERWLRAVALHDALKSAPKRELRALAENSWGVDALLHGPAAAMRAEEEGETDRGVLDAVRYHSVGYAGWDLVGRILYLADFLEPGRSFHSPDHDSLILRVPNDVDAVLRDVAKERVSGTIALGKPLLPEVVGFWNSLVLTS
ncbi:MAG: HD domain-containing protein [Gemmatimonadota bacterium]|nr:MAG: HD domain-containing protein [Gemmatimonadota bacterium]